ncbi:MAG: hypothetical protein KAT34_08720 [Candidatus Aminicenantes bacterium]|nr:hypothetical protein [Candidatus Aminicenantes bacterium]
MMNLKTTKRKTWKLIKVNRIRISKILIIISLISFGTFVNAFEKIRINENYNLQLEKNYDRAESKIYFMQEPEKKSTAYCLSCHDGVTAVDIHMTPGVSDQSKPKGLGLSHPVEINYENVYLKKRGTYNPPELLDPRIKLDKNNITCLSCHDENSSHKNHLVMENYRSRLCFSCHNL